MTEPTPNRFLMPHYRCSTDDRGQDPLRQDGACRPWATRHGFVLLNPVVDNGTSAFKTLALDRPKFVEACERAKAAGCEGLLLESPDRFSRVDPFRAIWETVEVFDRYGLAIYFASAPLELQTTFAGKLLLFVQLAMSHDWAVGHASKVQLGMEKKKAEGVKFGRKTKDLTPAEWEWFDGEREKGAGFDTLTVGLNERRMLSAKTVKEKNSVITLTKTTLRRAIKRREAARAESQKAERNGAEAPFRHAEETSA